MGESANDPPGVPSPSLTGMRKRLTVLRGVLLFAIDTSCTPGPQLADLQTGARGSKLRGCRLQLAALALSSDPIEAAPRNLHPCTTRRSEGHETFDRKLVVDDSSTLRAGEPAL